VITQEVVNRAATLLCFRFQSTNQPQALRDFVTSIKDITENNEMSVPPAPATVVIDHAALDVFNDVWFDGNRISGYNILYIRILTETVKPKRVNSPKGPTFDCGVAEIENNG